jgi:chemosensory pili system protein ChpA (sensor histidine kinase/response regulator)
MQNLVSESLQIVGEELAVTFNDVRVALEQYAEGEKRPQSMDRCLGLLRTAIGVLKLTETYGASLLTEEMEATCRHLAKLRGQDSGSDDAMDALSRAAVQLPAYVERIINGGRDVPLVLLPLLNDLRAARGKPLLSESTLLLLNVGSPIEQKAHMASRKISGEDVAMLCRKLRPGFQLALLGWIKDMKSEISLRQLVEVSERLEQAASTMEVHQLWWVVGGILEALLDDGLEASISLKRLIGQVDREMKRLMSVGEAQYSEQPPTELVNNLLYYVARATHTGPRVAAIRYAFNLSDLIPGDDQVEKVRQSLAAPSAKLMHTVAEAIRADLARVKDVLDIYVRTGMENIEELNPQIELLKKISDTMGVLGLGELRETIAAKRHELKAIIDRGERVNEATLMEMAAALLQVEDHLDDQLFGLIRPDEDESDGDEAESGSVDNDHKLVARAVMRESLINLARIKDAVSQVIEKPGESALLDSVPQYLRGITAGMLLLEKEAAVLVVDEIGKFIGEFIQKSEGTFEKRRLDLLADAIVSLEYYLETLQAGRKEPLYMLENARGCLKVLREDSLGAGSDFSDEALSGDATTMQIQTGEATIVSPDTPLRPEVSAAIGNGKDGGARVPVEPELIELFIEEAGEEIELINRLFLQWEQNENGHPSLVNIRRSFHTLKGSGHTVGADLIGEYCRSVENLLNRLINNTLEQRPEIVDFVGRAIELLPQLLEELEVGTPPEADVESIIAEAERLANSGSEPRPAVRQDDEVDSGSVLTPPRLDPVLVDILTKETATHLAEIRNFVEDCRSETAPHSISEELHRACHTLHGSVTMAKAEPAARITEPLNQMVQHAYDHNLAVDESVVLALAEIVRVLNSIVASLSDSGLELPDTSEFQAMLWRLNKEIEAQAELVETEKFDSDTISVKTLADEDDADIPLDETPVEQESEESGQATDEIIRPDFDPEIAEIFSDEAVELLDSIDATLTQSIQGEIGESSLAELQRYLHTLKGGARMAGLSEMGDLSHDLETFLLRIANGELRQDRDRRNLLQEVVDELHRLSEKVAHGIGESPPAGLVGRLHDALVIIDDDQEAVVDEQPTEPPVEELADEPVEEAKDDSTEETADDGFEAPEEQFVVAEEEAEPALKISPERGVTGTIPAAEQLGQLARELREPVKPEPRDLSELIRQVPDAPAPERRDFARINPEVLEQLLNNAGEVSIFHSRLSQQMNQIQFSLDELDQTVMRLRGQLRGLESATEAQILYQHHSEQSASADEDPLQLERYSKIQQFSRALGETANDVSSIRDILQNLTGDTEALLVQQARTAGELQDGLMRTRMVPFEQHAARLARLVRQMSAEHGKQSELSLKGGGEIDRQVLEKMLSPFEHMLRNAVIHGIESPADREAAGKSPTGDVLINVHREGSQVIVDISDDGRGMDVDSIRRKAVELGLMAESAEMADEDILQYVLRSGFSTADQLTQASGRGVGMDVVASEVAQIGGTLQISTKAGEGTTFSVRLPITLAVTQALIVRVGLELYALPLPTVEGIIRVSRSELREKMAAEVPTIDYGDQTYRLQHLGQYLGQGSGRISSDEERISIVLVQAGKKSTALVADEMLDSREIIVKPVGAQLASISGLSGATILGDGRIAVILDVGALVRLVTPSTEPIEVLPTAGDGQLVALVVDDSITMRRVSQRLLERNGMRVLTARDGMQAIEVLRDHIPDIILLDVEMPRMDGYQFAAFVRNNTETEDVPIVMITSRVSEEHKARAIELGVNDYLGKPYQESVLLNAVRNLVQLD